MASVSDGLGRRIELPLEAQRIVSLVPSDSYSLVKLGCTERLVGRSDYCDEPADLTSVPAVGGTKSVRVEDVVALKPDLVIANVEENRKVDIERLVARGLSVWLNFPKTVRQGLDHVEQMADLFPSIDNSAQLAQARARLDAFESAKREPVATFVPIWMDPLMTVNGDTFISDVVELCGGRNVFSQRRRRYPLSADLGRSEARPAGERDRRYPRIELAELLQADPAVVLLPNEPHAFDAKDAEFFESLAISAAGSQAIHLCNGRDLMWYGLRAVEGLERIAELLDGARFSPRGR